MSCLLIYFVLFSPPILTSALQFQAKIMLSFLQLRFLNAAPPLSPPLVFGLCKLYFVCHRCNKVTNLEKCLL